ncbi:biotin synthase [Sugiyamaella lignohabitans]|uniref:biotin synthase n=1 Tax=Sugiyamaella lignohabitans TaxID=796027 RepID=A0A167FDA1_9ASCO|nr:biotin synthase [Sugiyamaella lignohabitans]ANB15151.1 biotin synthase [Sugiyamaella lignohabitans]
MIGRLSKGVLSSSHHAIALFHTGIPAFHSVSTTVTAGSSALNETIVPPATTSSDLSTLLQNVRDNTKVRTNWTREEISALYNSPLMDLVYAGATVHRKFHDPSEVQLCTLMNIKSGGCTEDCKYCAQSSRYDTGVKAEKVVTVEQVISEARLAKENGSTRFCMGAAWRDMKGRKSGLKRIANMVSEVNKLGLESCVTLGMVNEEQMKELKDAGLTAYNHNVDTSREYYPSVISTRSYDERLQTIDNVRKSGVSVCSGGILGLGESTEDHIGFLHTLSTMPEHPESVPVNKLVPIKGTPLGDRQAQEIQLPFDAVLRTVATARLIMPKSIIRLAAGRYTMKEQDQMMCFMAGANAIFTGKKMLTTMCNDWNDDKTMLSKWGMKPMKSFERKIKNAEKLSL